MIVRHCLAHRFKCCKQLFRSDLKFSLVMVFTVNFLKDKYLKYSRFFFLRIAIGGGGGEGLACKAKEAVCNEANSHNHYQEHSIPCTDFIGPSLSQ